MPIDFYRPGDENCLELFDPEGILSRFRWLLERSADYFSYEVYGLENLPREGGGLLVSNHGTVAVDALLLIYRVYQETGRIIRGLGEHLLWRVPLLRIWLLRSGILDGNMNNAVKLLQGGLALVYPGGSRESLKPSYRKYELLWEERYGFIKAALLAQVPILPVAAIGVDDLYFVFNSGMGIVRRFFERKWGVSLPLLLGLGPFPFPTKVVSSIGHPISLGYPPEAAENPGVLIELHEKIRATLQGMLAEGLSSRRIPWG